MRVEQFNASTQRLLALLLLGVVLLLGAGLVAGPYLAIAGNYDRTLDRLAEKLARYKGIVREGETAKEYQRTLTRLERTHGYYLGGNKPTLAAAELQRHVKQVIEQHGGTVVSSQVLGDKNEQGLQQIALRVTMRTGMGSFGKVLHALEAHPPVLVVENMHIGARPSGGAARWRGSGTQQELDTRFDVIGFGRGMEPL